MREWLLDKEVMLGTIIIILAAIAFTIVPVFV